MRGPAHLADAVLEVSVVGSYTNIGFQTRRILFGWQSPEQLKGSHPLRGATVVMTGAGSLIGTAAAAHFVRLGASLHLIAREPAAAAEMASDLNSMGASGTATPHAADLTDLCSAASLCERLAMDLDRVDVLVHNAGDVTHQYETGSAGHEATYVSQVLTPHLITGQLLASLTPGGRVLTVSSGGMYGEKLIPERMELPRVGFEGTRAFSRAKRAQVELAAEWARRFGDTNDVVFQVMHPGWSQSAGAHDAPALLQRVTKPVLRDADAAADTLVWLAVSDEGARDNGSFWMDRRVRATARLPFHGSTAQQRAQLWELVDDQVHSAIGDYLSS